MDDGTETKTSAVPEVLAGAALGLLFGLLVGLTTSSVVASIVTSIAALITSIIGVSEKAPLNMGAASPSKLASFSIAAVAALLVGIFVRTHSLLSPTPEEMYLQLKAAKYEDQEIKDIVRFRQFGLVPSGMTEASPDNSVVRGYASVLFNTSEDVCNEMARDSTLALTERISRLRKYGDSQVQLATRIERLSRERQEQLMGAMEFYLCENNS